MQVDKSELSNGPGPRDGVSFDVKSYNIACLTGKVGMYVGNTPVTELFGLITIEGKPTPGYKKGAGMEIGFLGPNANLPSNQLEKTADRLEATLFLRIEQMAIITAQLQSKSARVIINTLGADACAIAT